MYVIPCVLVIIGENSLRGCCKQNTVVRSLFEACKGMELLRVGNAGGFFLSKSNPNLKFQTFCTWHKNWIKITMFVKIFCSNEIKLLIKQMPFNKWKTGYPKWSKQQIMNQSKNTLGNVLLACKKKVLNIQYSI